MGCNSSDSCKCSLVEATLVKILDRLDSIDHRLAELSVGGTTANDLEQERIQEIVDEAFLSGDRKAYHAAMKMLNESRKEARP